MQPSDLTELTMRVTQLAEALAGKSPTAGAMKVWFDALAACPLPDVLAVLTDWPKAHSKAPTPFDVLQECNKRAGIRLEREAADRAKQARDPWSPEQLRGDPNSPAYREFCAAFRALKRSRIDDDELIAERQAIQSEPR